MGLLWCYKNKRAINHKLEAHDYGGGGGEKNEGNDEDSMCICVCVGGMKLKERIFCKMEWW